MSLQNTPSSERLHIGFFGRRNVGKSSLVNRVTEQELSVVSDTKGTTTDPVQKAMELLPIGPVVIIDTPGYDDVGALGEKRVRKTKEILNRVDIAVLVTDAETLSHPVDRALLQIFREKKLPYVICHNKSESLPDFQDNAFGIINDETQEIPAALLSSLIHDQGDGETAETAAAREEGPKTLARGAAEEKLLYGEIRVSALTNQNVYLLKALIGRLGKSVLETKDLLEGLVTPGDLFILVIPVDSSAPKGRLILPQQMVLAEILNNHARALCCQPEELKDTIALVNQDGTNHIRLVITDSQAFKMVSAIVPREVPLSSFSILMARYKGFLTEALKGVAAIEKLQDGDRVLISEGCTHHRMCDDIGSFKIPTWLRKYTGKELEFEVTSGHGFPEALTDYRLIIHCGACMLNDREVLFRMKQAQDQGVPFTNYGTCISFMNGILERAVAPVVH